MVDHWILLTVLKNRFGALQEGVFDWFRSVQSAQQLDAQNRSISLVETICPGSSQVHRIGYKEDLHTIIHRFFICR